MKKTYFDSESLNSGQLSAIVDQFHAVDFTYVRTKKERSDLQEVVNTILENYSIAEPESFRLLDSLRSVNTVAYKMANKHFGNVFYNTDPLVVDK